MNLNSVIANDVKTNKEKKKKKKKTWFDKRFVTTNFVSTVTRISHYFRKMK